jgi:hypothetical protein
MQSWDRKGTGNRQDLRHRLPALRSAILSHSTGYKNSACGERHDLPQNGPRSMAGHAVWRRQMLPFGDGRPCRFATAHRAVGRHDMPSRQHVMPVRLRRTPHNAAARIRDEQLAEFYEPTIPDRLRRSHGNPPFKRWNHDGTHTANVLGFDVSRPACRRRLELNKCRRETQEVGQFGGDAVSGMVSPPSVSLR